MTALPSHSGAPPPPLHVAIIMDGNGRWAKARGLPRTAGHRKGVEALRRTVYGAADLGISYLTLYGFSSENWNRPADEVTHLMGLLRYYLRNEIAELDRNGVCLRFIGNRERLSADIQKLITDAEEKTRGNAKITMIVALSYGSRDEIVMAARDLAEQAVDGMLDPSAIDEDAVGRHLWTAGVPDPDVVIRTSGEQRLSNFLLWQAAYAELIFTDTFWPDFSKEDLERAIEEYRRRERRYGAAIA